MIATGRQLLKRAVHSRSLLGVRGLEERLFTAWFGGFFYNQIWEDPRVDLAALQLTADSRLLAISSAGCNLLNYLTVEGGPIVAVDLNPHHVYLTRLKLAALRRLPDYESFFRFFGRAGDPANLEGYRTHIREGLDPEARRFWDGGSWLRRRLRGSRVRYFKRNLYDHARLGLFLRAVHGLARLQGRDPARLLASTSLDEQREVFERDIEPFFDHWLVRLAGRMPFLLFGLGVPPRQFDSLRREGRGSLTDVYRQRVRRLACAHPLSDNYFAWQAFGRRYDLEARRALPPYLQQKNYRLIKHRVGRVQAHMTSLHAYMMSQPDDSLDRFVFLDAQDWMKPEEIVSLWREVARTGRPGSRVIFRTASATSPVEEALPRQLRKRFVYQRELSQRLHQRDRSAIYGGFHVYEKPR
jgi:S-adenosylmethionine-diacylglycerol 3-amino-3-carboxypropyl transferase